MHELHKGDLSGSVAVGTKQKAPGIALRGEGGAATYSPAVTQYHRRWRALLPCSEWEGVSPAALAAQIPPPGGTPGGYAVRGGRARCWQQPGSSREPSGY